MVLLQLAEHGQRLQICFPRGPLFRTNDVFQRSNVDIEVANPPAHRKAVEVVVDGCPSRLEDDIEPDMCGLKAEQRARTQTFATLI